MKKLFLFTVFAIAIASFGVHSSLAHAQTYAPAAGTQVSSQNAAALEQELEVAKATLVNLEMKAGVVPSGDDAMGTGVSATASVPPASVAPQASAGLSSADRATLQGALGSLTAALSSLNATFAAHPDAVTLHAPAIASILGGMRNTVLAMGNALNGAPAQSNAPVAAATPSSAGSSGAGTAVAQNQTPTPTVAVNQPAPGTGSLAPSAAAPASTNNAQQTAQASNGWSFVTDHWPTITIILLVALILLILFWPSKGDERHERDSRVVVAPQTPSRPTTTTTISVSESSKPGNAQAATPVSTVVASPTKVTVVRPADPKNKPA